METDFRFRNGNGMDTYHRVKIFKNDNWTTVLCTDRSTQYGCMSITNSIDFLMTELLRQQPSLANDRLMIIEHYDDLDPQTFDLVILERRKNGTYTNPEWRSISVEEAASWCGLNVEELCRLNQGAAVRL